MRDPAGESDADDPRPPEEPAVAEGRPSPDEPVESPASFDPIERLRADIAEEIDRREAEIDRRERTLSEQLAALDRERRGARFAEQAFGERCRSREVELTSKEVDLAYRLSRCEELIAELEAEQSALDGDRSSLQARQLEIREAVLGDLAAERQAIDAERESLFAEKKELRRRVELHEREAAAARDGLRKSWEAEREALRKQLTAKLATELTAERQAFEQERAAWTDRRREEQTALEDERAAHDRLVEQAKADFERLRREQEIEFARRRRDLETEIESQVRAAEAAFHAERAEWEVARTAAESDLRTARDEFKAERSEHEERSRAEREAFERHREERLRQIETEAAAVERSRTSADEERRALGERAAAELAAARESHDRGLAAERAAFAAEQEASRLALDEERAVMENRLHFQRTHLDRTRDELEEARRELERRLQEGRTQAVALADEFRLRRAHLGRFRQLLDDRERAIERDRESLAEARAGADEARRRDADRRDGDEDAWLREKQAEQVAVKQLRDDLATRAEGLAARQARLDTLRLELETTHRENLELRVALDETWVKLAQDAGAEQAKQQLQATRTVVARQFREKEAELDRRRASLADELAAARKQLDQVESRRKELSEWLGESLTTLHRREEELKRWAATLDARESRSLATTGRWRDEKSEAEGVIRGLLKQLTEAAEAEPALVSPECATAIVAPKLLTAAAPHLRLAAPSPATPERAAG